LGSVEKADVAGGLDLKNRVVLVTGAGRGLGEAYATCLARHGAHVVVHDAGVNEDGGDPNPTCAARVADALLAEGGSALAVTEVLRSAASCRRVVAAALDRFGRLDGLIHNAGLVVWRDPALVDEDLYATLSSVNNDAAFWLCSAALPAMRAQGFGRIVLSTSGWALQPSTGSDELVLYTHGKGAQFGLAMGLAQGAGHPGILTNLIAPVAKTRMFRGAVPSGQLRPELVAGAVAWMASPACTLTGCIVQARNGTLTLTRLAAVGTRDLGEAACDPVAAGMALAGLAENVTVRA
jgi:NAD(P)-dependent dehydrogenase (short-subunit alcohol dehydrogenase family)